MRCGDEGFFPVSLQGGLLIFAIGLSGLGLREGWVEGDDRPGREDILISPLNNLNKINKMNKMN